MFFVLSVPFWLFVLIWIFSTPSRRRARRAAAQMQELQVVAAMTEGMKEEYWARKQAEASAPPPPFRGFIAVLLLFGCLFVILAGIAGH
jgi:hypothetical protein